MPSDRELRRGYSRLLELQSGKTDRSGCVPAEEILALAERSGGEEARLLTLDHVMACPACREDFELLKALAGAGIEEKVVPLPLPWKLTPWTLSWAASVILFIGAASLWWGAQRQDPGIVMRGAGDDIQLIAAEAGAGVEAGITFAWHPLSGGFEYTVEVFDEEGEVILAASTSDTTYTVEDMQPGMAGEGLRWWVTARTENGGWANSEVRILDIPR